jgi:hypothetical protein
MACSEQAHSLPPKQTFEQEDMDDSEILDH